MEHYKVTSNPRNLVRGLVLGVVGALALLSGCISANLEQPKETQQPVNVSKDQGYRADIQELADRIKAEHPRPFRFITEADFDELVSARIGDMSPGSTDREFLWALNEILAAIECGHSKLPYFSQENALIEAEDRFPVDVRFVNDRLLIIDPLINKNVLKKGDEIVAINGQSVHALRNDIFRHIQAEGVATHRKNHDFNAHATSYLTYALSFPSAYAVTLVDNNTPVALQPLQDFEFQPLIHPNNPCQDTLCYRVDDISNSGVMAIHSFEYYGDSGQIFADYVDTSLADIVDNDRSALIIDIRFHNGGSGRAGAYILRRLASRPFNYFGGMTDKRASDAMFELQMPVDSGLDVPVYLIVDGWTVSSAPHFAALFKEHKMGTIVGEPMGGNKSTNDGKQRFKSSVNGVEYTIARMRFDIDAPSQSLEKPVQPDIVLSYTSEDILNGEDSMMHFVQSLIVKAKTEK